MLKQWIHKCGRAGGKSTRYARLCSAYFEESCFEVGIFHQLMSQDPSKCRRWRTLKPEEVPTNFQHEAQPKASIQRKHSIKRTVKSESEAVSKQ